MDKELDEQTQEETVYPQVQHYLDEKVSGRFEGKSLTPKQTRDNQTQINGILTGKSI